MITSTEDLLSAKQFKTPEELFPDTTQRELFVKLIGLVQDNCSDESGWEGQLLQLGFETGHMPVPLIKRVVEAVTTRCGWIDITTSGVLMKPGSWILNVQGTAFNTTLKAA